MKWYEYLIIIVSVVLVVTPIVTYFVKKKNKTLKCECGHLQSECIGNCSSCNKEKKNDNPTLTYVVGVNGMKCGMCESHINDVIRKNFDIVKVKSSRKHNTTTIITKSLLNIPKLKNLIANEGYDVSSIKLI